MIGRDNPAYQKEQNDFLRMVLTVALRNPDFKVVVPPDLLSDVSISEFKNIQTYFLNEDYDYKINLKKSYEVIILDGFDKKLKYYQDMQKTYPNIKYTLEIDILNLDHILQYKSLNIEKVIIKCTIFENIRAVFDMEDIRKITENIYVNFIIDINESSNIKLMAANYVGCLRFCYENGIKLCSIVNEARTMMQLDSDGDKVVIKSPALPDEEHLYFGKYDKPKFMENLDAYNPEMALSILATNPSLATPGCDTCDCNMSCPKQPYTYRYRKTKDVYLPHLKTCEIYKEAFKKLGEIYGK